MKIKQLIIDIRQFIVNHVSNQYMRQLVYGLISYEMLSYVFFGIFTALIDYVVYALLSSKGVNELLANVFAWLLSVIFAYVTNRVWVFKSGLKEIRVILDEFVKFMSVRLSTLIMTEVILFTAQMMKLNTYRAKIAAMVLTVILNYVFSKLFIFKKEGKKK